MQYSHIEPKKQYYHGLSRMQADFGFPPIPKTPPAVRPKTADERWKEIPIDERFELLATIQEMREWRFGAEQPPWLAPLRQAAFELHLWLKRHADVR